MIEELLLGYNYQSSQWYKQTYKVFNKNYQPNKKKVKNEKNKESLIEKIKSKIFHGNSNLKIADN